MSLYSVGAILQGNASNVQAGVSQIVAPLCR